MAKLGQYNLEEMTAQEVGEAAALHLFEQSKESLDDGGGCVYNGDGVCCAAAPFIRDYHKDMECLSWVELVKKYGQSDSHICLICDLQMVHDLMSVSLWKQDLIDIFERHNLNPKILSEWEWNKTENKYVKVVD